MPLILAIEPDRHQASQLNAIVRSRLHAELVIEATAERALAALGDRVPDLILTAALLSPKDEAALAGRLRQLESAAAHIHTITIPVLAAPRSRPRIGGMLSALRRDKSASEVDGCDPAVFAEQCATYLERAIAERQELASATTDEAGSIDAPSVPDTNDVPAAAPIVDDAFDPVDVTAAFSEAIEERVEEAMRFEQTGDEAAVEPAIGEPRFEEVSGQPVLEEAIPRETIEDRVEDEPLAAAAGEQGDEPPIEDTEEQLDAAAVEEELAEAAVDDNLDAPSAPAFGAPALGRDHLLEESPLFELVMEADEQAQTGADGEGAEDEESYIELDLSEFLDEPARIDADSPDIAAATSEPEAGDAAPAAWEEPAFVEPADEGHDLAARAPVEDDWLEVVAALRRDVERLDAAPARGAKPLKKLPRKSLKGKPVQDEWGFFDPEQCGFAALLAKLDEVTPTDDPARRRNRA